jgi:hypothetical protein
LNDKALNENELLNKGFTKFNCRYIKIKSWNTIKGSIELRIKSFNRRYKKTTRYKNRLDEGRFSRVIIFII